jgi:hypothetical protein
LRQHSLSKATKLLLSTGLANSQDPGVKQALLDLHPVSHPHLVMGADLPMDVASNVTFEGDKEAEEAEWTMRARRAITSFPPGSAGVHPVCAPSTSASAAAKWAKVHRSHMPWANLRESPPNKRSRHQ